MDSFRDTNKEFYDFSHKKFTKEHLDSVFSDYKAKKSDFDSLSISQKRRRDLGDKDSVFSKKQKISKLNFENFFL